MKHKRFLSFYDSCDDEFDEYLDGVKLYLQENNKEYKNLLKKFNKIIDNSNQTIQNILCHYRRNKKLTF